HLPLMWAERNVAVPEDAAGRDLVVVPDDAQYFAAIGAVRFGLAEAQDNPDLGRYQGTGALRASLEAGRGRGAVPARASGLVRDEQELARFVDRFLPHPWAPPPVAARDTR